MVWLSSSGLASQPKWARTGVSNSTAKARNALRSGLSRKESSISRIEARIEAGGGALSRRRPVKNPENTGSQRLIAIAEEGERFDRALWTPTAAATGGAGNSNALVGTPETVAQAILDYIDLGVDIISMRGYDLLKDAVDVGQQVIPIVREEVAKRDAAAGIA